MMLGAKSMLCKAKWAAGLAMFGAVSLTTTARAVERQPLGEREYFQVDTRSSRTTSMVQSGWLTTTVTRFMPDDPEGPSYELRLDYSFNILFVGTRSGSQAMAIPAAYFTPEFMAELRRSGEYSSPQMKIRHLGYGRARTMFGNTYENCDKILIYDIQIEALPWAEVAAAVLAPHTADQDRPLADQIEDLEITAHIKEGIPALGGVLIDVTGVTGGVNFRAGGDYKP